jgi:tetratricopeptide (TPR) repeat protein
MVDLSQDLEGFLATKGAEAAASESAQQAASFNFDDTKIEISFYLEQGFFEEARGAVESLEETFRGDPRIAELRALVKAYTSGMPFEPPPKPPAVAQERAPVRVDPPGQQAVDRRESATGPEVPKPEGQPAIAPSIFPGEEEPPPGAGVDTSTHLVGDFSEGIESGMGRPGAHRISGESKELALQPAQAEAEGQRPRVASDASSPKPGLEDDAEAHFNLGVAFWEMKHLDQAIREFQKVVNGAEKTSLPANYLQACSLLAACFMDKGMAPIAAKWYCRALETPHLDDEVRLALQYDLGVAYERAGDLPRALEMFSEVYGRRIDFRDVAEKVRAFQQKSS